MFNSLKKYYVFFPNCSIENIVIELKKSLHIAISRKDKTSAPPSSECHFINSGTDNSLSLSQDDRLLSLNKQYIWDFENAKAIYVDPILRIEIPYFDYSKINKDRIIKVVATESVVPEHFQTRLDLIDS